MSFTGFGYATPDMIAEAQRAQQAYRESQYSSSGNGQQHNHNEHSQGNSGGNSPNNFPKRRTPFQDPYSAGGAQQERQDPFAQQNYYNYPPQQRGNDQRRDPFGQRRDPFGQQAQGQYQTQPIGMPKRKADPFSQQAQGGYDQPTQSQFPERRDPYAQPKQYDQNAGGFQQKQDPFRQQVAGNQQYGGQQYGGQQVQKPNPFAPGNFSDDDEDDEPRYQPQPQAQAYNSSHSHKRKVDPFASSLDSRKQYNTPADYQQADVKFEESGEKKQSSGAIKNWFKSKKKNNDEFGSYASTDGEDEDVAYNDNKIKDDDELNMLPRMQIKPAEAPKRKKKKNTDNIGPSNLNPQYQQPFDNKFLSDDEEDEDDVNQYNDYNDNIPPPKGFGNSPFSKYAGASNDSPSPPSKKFGGSGRSNPFQNQLVDDDTDDYVPPPQRESPFPKSSKPSPFEMHAQQNSVDQPLQSEPQQYQQSAPPSFPRSKQSPFQQQAAPQFQQPSPQYQQPQQSPFQQQAGSPFQQHAAPSFPQQPAAGFPQPTPFGQTRSTPSFQQPQQQYGQQQFNNYEQQQGYAQPAYNGPPPQSADDLLFIPTPPPNTRATPSASEIMTIDISSPQQAPPAAKPKQQGMFDEFGDLVQLDLRPGNQPRPMGRPSNVRGSFQ